MRKLIVNADDFGFNREITDGILDCFRTGCVTSTTLMTNMPAARYAVDLAKNEPKLSVGVHLNMTLGKPLMNPDKVAAILAAEGTFLKFHQHFKYGFFLRSASHFIESEFTAQVQKAFDLGMQPTHLDSHHNITVYPQIYRVLLAVAGAFSIKRLRTYRGWYRSDCTDSNPRYMATCVNNLKRATKLGLYECMHRDMRRKGFLCPDHKVGFHTIITRTPLDYTIDDWSRFVRNLPEGVSEFVTHPGYISEDPYDRPEYRKRRVKELSLLSDPKTRWICQENDVELINYTQIDGLFENE